MSSSQPASTEEVKLTRAFMLALRNELEIGLQATSVKALGDQYCSAQRLHGCAIESSDIEKHKADIAKEIDSNPNKKSFTIGSKVVEYTPEGLAKTVEGDKVTYGFLNPKCERDSAGNLKADNYTFQPVTTEAMARLVANVESRSDHSDEVKALEKGALAEFGKNKDLVALMKKLTPLQTDLYTHEPKMVANYTKIENDYVDKKGPAGLPFIIQGKEGVKIGMEDGSPPCQSGTLFGIVSKKGESVTVGFTQDEVGATKYTHIDDPKKVFSRDTVAISFTADEIKEVQAKFQHDPAYLKQVIAEKIKQAEQRVTKSLAAQVGVVDVRPHSQDPKKVGEVHPLERSTTTKL